MRLETRDVIGLFHFAMGASFASSPWAVRTMVSFARCGFVLRFPLSVATSSHDRLSSQCAFPSLWRDSTGAVYPCSGHLGSASCDRRGHWRNLAGVLAGIP